MIVYGKTLNGPDLKEALERKHRENVRILKLQAYYEGKHEILERYYLDSTKPNNRIVVNYCKQIADFLTAYLVGVPVQFGGVNAQVQAALKDNDEADVATRTVTNMNIAGFAVELFYHDEVGETRYDTIDPTECIIFMDDELSQDIIGFVRMVPNDPEKVGGYTVYVYDTQTVTVFALDEGMGSFKVIEKPVRHFFNDVPIVFYPNNDTLQGSFEQIIPLQDSLNKIYSDNVNDFEQFVDAYLVLVGMDGTTEQDIQDMKRNRVLLLPPDSEASWLIKDVNNDHIKQLQDDITKQIMFLGNIPDMTDIKGLNISGEAMRMRLVYTEIQAARQERIVAKGLHRKAGLLGDYGVELTFTRNFLVEDETTEEVDTLD